MSRWMDRWVEWAIDGWREGGNERAREKKRKRERENEDGSDLAALSLLLPVVLQREHALGARVELHGLAVRRIEVLRQVVLPPVDRIHTSGSELVGNGGRHQIGDERLIRK